MATIFAEYDNRVLVTDGMGVPGPMELVRSYDPSTGEFSEPLPLVSWETFVQSLVLVTPRPLIQQEIITAFKSMPHDDGEDELRNRLERSAEERIYRAFREAHAEILAIRNLDVDKALRALDKARNSLRDAVQEMFTSAMLAGAQAGQDQVEWLLGQKKAPPVDLTSSWDLVHTDALNWASRFTARTLDGLNVTSSGAVSSAVQTWIDNGLPLPSLDRALAPTFGRKRAKLIASTEVTRAYARGSIVAWKRSGFVTANEWRTGEDELVCPVCGKLANRSTTLNQYFRDPATNQVMDIWTPPAHPGCRCWLVPIITEPDIPADWRLETDEERRIREELEEMERILAEREFWPSDPNNLKFVRTLGGSTGAELVEDTRNGRLFVRKHGASPDHLLEEFMADEMYRVAGFDVPKGRLYTGTGPHGDITKLSEFIEGESLASLKSRNLAKYTQAQMELRKGFVMDSLMGNWDVIGMNADNILVDKAGKVWRIDNGGSLRYRAMGRLKSKMGTEVTEIWTMRDPAKNPSTASVFAGMDYGKEIIPQMRHLLQMDVEDAIRDIPWRTDSGMTVVKNISELSMDLAERFRSLETNVEIFDRFTKDQWKPDYIEKFSKHFQMLEDARIYAGMSSKLQVPTSGSRYMLQDDQGETFDKLRDYQGGSGDSISGRFAKYLTSKQNSIISTWSDQQAGSSWSHGAITGKYALYEARGVHESKYFWGTGTSFTHQKNKALAYLRSQGWTLEEFQDAIAAQHALTYRIFTTVQIPNVDRQRRVIRQLIRTESWDVLKKYGFSSTPSKTKRLIERGVLESSSLIKPFSYQGDHVTVHEIPIERIVGSYLTARPNWLTHGLFAGDNENELLALFEGIEAEYLGQMSSVKVNIQP